jgi:hypothetical protein
MKDILTSRWMWWAAGIVAALVIFFLAFGLGVSVGYQKAIFASEWGRNYERNFSGPHPRGIMPGTAGGAMHGAAGTVMDIESSTLAVRDNDNDEESVVVTTDTILKEMDATTSWNNLMVGDRVVVIGAPNDTGQVEAQFIRVFPALLPGAGPGGPSQQP